MTYRKKDLEGARRSNEARWISQQMPYYDWACKQIERVNDATRKRIRNDGADALKVGPWYPFPKSEHGYYELPT